MVHRGARPGRGGAVRGVRSSARASGVRRVRGIDSPGVVRLPPAFIRQPAGTMTRRPVMGAGDGSGGVNCSRPAVHGAGRALHRARGSRRGVSRGVRVRHVAISISVRVCPGGDGRGRHRPAPGVYQSPGARRGAAAAGCAAVPGASRRPGGRREGLSRRGRRMRRARLRDETTGQGRQTDKGGRRREVRKVGMQKKKRQSARRAHSTSHRPFRSEGDDGQPPGEERT